MCVSVILRYWKPRNSSEKADRWKIDCFRKDFTPWCCCLVRSLLIHTYVPLYRYTMESKTFKGCIWSLCTELCTLWNFKDWMIKNVLLNHRSRNPYSTSENLWFHCDIWNLAFFPVRKENHDEIVVKKCVNLLSDQALCLASIYHKINSTLWAIIRIILANCHIFLTHNLMSLDA